MLIQNTDAALLFHAEVEVDGVPETENSGKDPHDFDTFLQSRPQQMEINAINMIIRLQRSYPPNSSVRCHVVHLTAADALPIIREAKSSGLNLTVETCFHYLTFISSDVPSGHPEFKCCPPIRDASNREQLWKALEDGTIDFVVSDHSPCVSSLKTVDQGNFMKAWGGISGLGLGLSALWTGACQRNRNISIGRIIDWTSFRTAVHARLADRKGKIQIGHDADLIIWDPHANVQVSLLFIFTFLLENDANKS